MATGIALRFLGLSRMRQRIERDPARPNGAALSPVRMARLAHLAAQFGPYRPACLVRALALQRLMRRHGFQSTLCIGVRKVGSLLEAHAWVEHEGGRLLDADDIAGRYAPFESLPAGLE